MATTVGMPPLWSSAPASSPRCGYKSNITCHQDQITHLQHKQLIQRTTQTRTLPFALCLEDARTALENSIRQLEPPSSKHGILRLQVPLPRNVKALHWVQCQPESCSQLHPRIYFSPRNAPDSCMKTTNSFTVAGVGSSLSFRGEEPFSVEHWESINRFLCEDSPLVRAYGAMRFNPESQPSPHWQEFGTFFFFIPQIELCEAGNYSLLAANLAWADDMTFEMAGQTLLTTLSSITVQITSPLGKIRVNNLTKLHTPDQDSWHSKVGHILEQLNHSNGFTKTVMARETKLEVEGQVPPFTLLAALQEQNPFAYQFCLQLTDGTAFIGNTPEQLFARDGLVVTSEAVAATRPRGATGGDDHLITLDLLQSSKDHNEFNIVQEGVRKAMESVCRKVDTVMTKGIVKQPKVQHLCTRFVGELHDKHEEYDLLAALQPTAAVCGHPRDMAKAAIAGTEAFDRGLYAGPVGWFGGHGSEFAVGIRSALITSTKPNNGLLSTTGVKDIRLFAGVGIVHGSNSQAEWEELELKISQFESLLRPSKKLGDAANINMLWANLIVEECCRLGVTCFCIAPGSRSSPLAEAAAANPRVSCVSCVDERALAYFAVGYGRGARKPAVVVTTSGTALSNLLPAVVEASQDCVPLLVLSADRPHELRDTGANQTINQVEHFGKFVRYHFDFPAASDEAPARMVLTTVDTAVFHATSDPYGPVHLNCPLREPLEAVPQQWDLKCVNGLTQWMNSSSPFTTYISNSDAGALSVDTSSSSQMVAVTDIIASATRGLIVVGGLHHSQSTWGVYKLAEHLKWPLVPDILSGFRLTSSKTVKIIHNLDHVLLSSRLQTTLAPDVILQIGSRITSKRLSRFLQECSPSAYILIEEHPFRHDPAHRLTHRIKCPVALFTRIVLAELASYTSPDNAYSLWLDRLSQTVRMKILRELESQVNLTEPAVARIVSASISSDSAIFLGNSMPIRDVDMYADVFCCSQQQPGTSTSDDQNVPVITMVAANRGASGIDGVISSAAGFAAGSKKRVTLLLGDLSFLHDTNGLMLLSGRDAQPPITVVVVNNHGGGIFSLLPVAEFMTEVPFRTLISTEHDVQLEKLCCAHRINHVHVKSKDELEQALAVSYSSSSHWIIEAESSIKENANFHRYLQDELRCYIDRIFPILWRRISQPKKVISSFDTFSYRFPMHDRVTTASAAEAGQAFYRHGFLLRVFLSDESSGLGEIAPLPGLHDENLTDVQKQLSMLTLKLKHVEVPEDLALLDGSFSRWFSTCLGAHQAKAIFPSVRSGIEMAILNALAASNKCSLWELLSGKVKERSVVEICGLIDCQGPPSEVALAATLLIKKGFTTLKMKVARRTPLEDAAAVSAVRNRVGRNISIRVDANRMWTFSQALEFVNAVQGCNIQYLEEPVRDLSSLPDFLKQSCVPIALDETIDHNADNYAQFLESLPDDNLVAAVIKPSRVGGFEAANLLIGLSLKRKLIPVLSSCFESSVALASFAEFAAFVQHSSCTTYKISTPAQGLGTYTWTAQDLVEPDFPQNIIEGKLIVSQATTVFSSLRWSLLEKCEEPSFKTFSSTIKLGAHRFKFGILEVSNLKKPVQNTPTLVFLHGFLGSAQDWIPIMTSLSSCYNCIAINLPGHGQKPWASSVTGNDQWGMELFVDALVKLLQQISDSNAKKMVLIGYSMGARVALCMAVRELDLIHAVVSISGNPGIANDEARNKRAMQDDDLVNALRNHGLESFIRTWYQKPLWKSLRGHPDFEALQKMRLTLPMNLEMLASTMSCLSLGRQKNLWDVLDRLQIPVLLVVGKLDCKFVKIAEEMKKKSPRQLELAQIDNCGHCIHVESPLHLLSLLHSFVLAKVV